MRRIQLDLVRKAHHPQADCQSCSHHRQWRPEHEFDLAAQTPIGLPHRLNPHNQVSARLPIASVTSQPELDDLTHEHDLEGTALIESTPNQIWRKHSRL